MSHTVPVLLTGAALAKRLGVPANTVYAWRQKGTIPFIQPPGLTPRYVEHDVREWLDQHRQQPTPCAIDEAKEIEDRFCQDHDEFLRQQEVAQRGDDGSCDSRSGGCK